MAEIKGCNSCIYQSTKNTIGNSDIHYVFNKRKNYLMMVTVHCISLVMACNWQDITYLTLTINITIRLLCALMNVWVS